jgi:Ca-activated chloride channel family protein
MYELEQKSYFFLLILVILIALIFAWAYFWKIKKQKEFASHHLIKQLIPDYSLFKSILKTAFLIFAVINLIFALVNLKIGTKSETVKREGIDIVFAVDVSRSMLCEDVAPSRLEKSKQFVTQTISKLQGDRIGIVAYAGSAFPVLPMTTDYSIAKMFLQQMNPDMVSAQGTSLGDAIDLSADLFNQADATNKLIILLSDGEDHEELITDAIEKAKEKNMKIITIGLGTEAGGPIPIKENGEIIAFKRDSEDNVVTTKFNDGTLKEIANETKGGYIYGSTTQKVTDYLNDAIGKIEKSEFEATQMADFKSQFQWFLFFALCFLFADIFMHEKQTNWIKKLNLFNENKA